MDGAVSRTVTVRYRIAIVPYADKAMNEGPKP